jgi:PAS domain S-box-containing protein
MDSAPIRITGPGDLEPLGSALTALGVALTLVDREMKVHWANALVQDIAEELSCGGHHCFQALWRAGQRCPDCLPLLVFRTGRAQEGVRERGVRGGPPEAYRVRAVPVYDAGGALAWVAESFIKLSALGPGLAGGRGRLAAESAAAMGGVMVVVDREERIVSWGPEAEAIFGWAQDEALGKRIDLVVPEDRLDEERAVAAGVARDGSVKRFDTVRLGRDGRRIPVALSAVALRDEAGALIGRSLLVRDVSALQALRTRVATQEQLLAHINREAADAIVGTDLAGAVTSWNRAAEQLVGRSAEAVLGHPLSEAAGCPAVEPVLARAREGRPMHGHRLEWCGADGEPVTVEVSAQLLGGAAGEEQGIALVARDVSSSQRLERQMMRSEKLAVVGSLAAGLAHEIGTPLNVISATAEYLLLDGAPSAHGERLRQIVAETDRISRLVRELLSLARTSGVGLGAVSVGEAVERVLSFLAVPLARKHVRVERDLGQELPPVLADPDGLQQVLLNLVVNAVQAVADGGRVVVRARAGMAGAAAVVTLEVEDDGPGVPDHLRERIFDPFFTTRPDGTGLGLAVCSRVVASQGGDLSVGRGQLGGACFSVLLPVAEVGA